MPDPWGIGSARRLASLGFAALATTSPGHAASLGRSTRRSPSTSSSTTRPRWPPPCTATCTYVRAGLAAVDREAAFADTAEARPARRVGP